MASRKFTPVVRVRASTISTTTLWRGRRSVSVTSTWRCQLACGHVYEVSQLGRGGPPDRMLCRECAKGGA